VAIHDHVHVLPDGLSSIEILDHIMHNRIRSGTAVTDILVTGEQHCPLLVNLARSRREVRGASSEIGSKVNYHGSNG
jgi:hypothetical protein